MGFINNKYWRDCSTSKRSYIDFRHLPITYTYTRVLYVSQIGVVWHTLSIHHRTIINHSEDRSQHIHTANLYHTSGPSREWTHLVQRHFIFHWTLPSSGSSNNNKNKINKKNRMTEPCASLQGPGSCLVDSPLSLLPCESDEAETKRALYQVYEGT